MASKELRVTKGGFATTRSSPSYVKISTAWHRLAQQDQRFAHRTWDFNQPANSPADVSILSHQRPRKLLDVEQNMIQSPRLEVGPFATILNACLDFFSMHVKPSFHAICVEKSCFSVRLSRTSGFRACVGVSVCLCVSAYLRS